MPKDTSDKPVTDPTIAHAWAVRREGRLDEAEAMLLAVIERARAHADTALQVRAMSKLAHVKRDQSHDAEAERLYQEAITLVQDVDDAALQAHTIRHLADLYMQTGRSSDAETLYREALSLYESLPTLPSLDFANALRGLALQREAAGDDAEARRCWQQARARYEAAGVEAGVEECDSHLANENLDTP